MIAHESDAYYISVWHEMEAQRRASRTAINAALQSVRPIEIELDGWVRIVDFKYGLRPLSTEGSVVGVGGRFNYGRQIDPYKYAPFNALYLAEDEETAYREKFGLRKSDRVDGLQPTELALRKDNYVVVRVRGLATGIFDLTKKNVQPFVKAVERFKILRKLSPVALTTKLRPLSPITDAETLLRTIYHPYWEGWPRQHGIPANGQDFGLLVLAAGFEGILYDSTKGDKRCLVLFPQVLEASSSFVELAGTAPPECTQRRMDRTNWRDYV